MFVDLSEVGRADVASVGGKGASLGEMARAGLAPPPGFVVTAAAYRAYVEQSGLWPIIAAELAREGVSRGAPEPCERASAAIRAAFTAAPFPDALRGPLASRWRALAGEGAVAVRSSATAEDLPEASFAGQQDTFLGVRGEGAVFDAVRACWSSLWTGRAIAYRARQGFDHAEVALAVVVQKMIAPEVAGVLFTHNPVNGAADEVLVTASWGLGESVVAGTVTPDTWRLSRTGAPLVRDVRIGSKEHQIVAVIDGGTRREPVPDDRRARACLPEPALAELVALAERVELHYGSPQDIEFGWEAGRFVLLQSRPITTRVTAPRSFSATQLRMLDDLLEHYPTTPFPADAEVMQQGYERLLEAMRPFGVHLPHARDILKMDDRGVFEIAPPTPWPTWRALLMPLAIARMASRGVVPWEPIALARGVDVAVLSAIDARTLDDARLAVHVRACLDAGYEVARIRFAEVIAPAAIVGVWLSALSRLAGVTVDPFEWLGGLAYVTVDVEEGLQDLADAVLADPSLKGVYEGADATAVAEALAGHDGYEARVEAFLGRFGARTAMVYLPFTTSSWREEPASLHRAVQALVRAADPGAAGRRRQGAVVRFEATRARVRDGLPGFLRGSFDRALMRYRAGHVAREATLYAIETANAAARVAFDEVGRRLHARGTLAQAHHVRYATISEALDALNGASSVDVRAVVSERRARREGAVQAWRTQRPPRAVATEGGLSGTPGSPGQARGPARVVLGPESFGDLQPGDVLVCPHTDPTWTPLFALAAGVVSDTGGPLSHAAIVAREYGIPAVLGTGAATTWLRSGEDVVVDGTRGTVARVAAAVVQGSR